MPDEPVVLSVNALSAHGDEGLVADAGVVRKLGCRPALVATGLLLGRAGRPGTVEPFAPSVVAHQLEAALSGGKAAAVRVGTLCGRTQVESFAGAIADSGLDPMVLAPRLRWNGTELLDAAAREAVIRNLFPRARLFLVRAGDLREWTGSEAEGLEGFRDAAQALRNRGARAVLVSGGAARGRVLDLLDDDGRTAWLDAPRIQAPRLEGLSDAHAAAVAASLARGLDPYDAACAAQRYVGFRLARPRD